MTAATKDIPQNDPVRLAHVQESFVRDVMMLRGFVIGLVPQRHLADDIVQETFVTACQKAHTYEPGSNFRAWILTIARYKVLAMLKRHPGAGLLSPDMIDLLAEERPPDSQLPERVAALDRCVAKLAPTARKAVTLRYQDDLGPSEIAREMGWSVNSLNVALSRARTFLRICVEETLRRGEVQ